MLFRSKGKGRARRSDRSRSDGPRRSGRESARRPVSRRERAGCRDCILLNAGDVAQGTPVSTIFHGLPVFEIANLLGIDAATLGNHDFHCYKRGGHGGVDLKRGIQVSCDVFFYEVARQLGIDKMEAAARAMGLGAATGI